MNISVVLPYKNEAPYLDACLASLARQSVSKFQLVAVDDGSGDSSREIVESYRSRIFDLVHVDNKGAGLVKALQNGISRADGALIFRADGDDIYHPRRLELQRDLLESGVDAAGCLVRFFPRRRLMEGFRIYEAWINRLLTPTAMAAELYVETPIAHPSLAVRRAAIEKIGGYRDVDWPEDFDLMIRLFQAGAVFAKVPRALLFWREHSQRLCRSDPRYNLDAFIRCRCHHLARGLLKDKNDLFIWGAGPIGKKTAACLLREGIDFKAFIDIDPRKIGGVVHDRKVMDPSILARQRGFVLSCVGKRNARYLVKAELESMGYRERLDFILTA